MDVKKIEENLRNAGFELCNESNSYTWGSMYSPCENDVRKYIYFNPVRQIINGYLVLDMIVETQEDIEYIKDKFDYINNLVEKIKNERN